MALCDQVIRFALYGMMFFLPIGPAWVESLTAFVILPYYIKRGILAYQTIQNSKTPLSLFAKIKIYLTSHIPQANPLRRPMGFFVLICFLSVIFSQYPHQSWSGFFGKLLQAVYIYFGVIETMNKRCHFQKAIGLFLLSSIVVNVSGVCQMVVGRGFIRGHLAGADGRIISSFDQANDYGGYLIMVVLMLLALLLGSFEKSLESKPKSGCLDKCFDLERIPVMLAILGILILAVFCLGYTFSRGAWVGVFLGCLYLSWQYRRVFYVPIVFVLLFAFVFGPKLVSKRNVSLISDNVRVSSTSAPEKESLLLVVQELKSFSGMGRRMFWQEAINIIKDYPVLGTGLNTYAKVAPKYKINWGGYAHNCYLQMAAEIGLLGLGIFIWIMTALYWGAGRAIAMTEDPFYRAVLTGGLAGLTGLFFQSFVDTDFYTIQLGNLLWLMMGWVLALGNLILRDRS